MTKLRNHELKEKSMQELLNTLNIANDNEQVAVSSGEGLYSLRFQNNQQKDDLVKLISNNNPETRIDNFTIDKIIEKAVQEGTTSDEKAQSIHRKSCQTILNVVFENLKSQDLSIEGNKLVLTTLPDKSYATLIKTLKYPNIEFNEKNQLLIDIEPYIFANEKGVAVLAQLNKNIGPIVFLGSEVIQTKKVHFKTKKLEDGKVEVTPFFFVPTADKVSPTYSFMLDTSSSIEPHLDKLKNEVKKIGGTIV